MISRLSRTLRSILSRAAPLSVPQIDPMAWRSCDLAASTNISAAWRAVAAPVMDDPMDGFRLQPAATTNKSAHFLTDGSKPV